MFYDDDDDQSKPGKDWWRWDDLAIAGTLVLYLALAFAGVFE